MYLKYFYDENLAQASYLVGCAKTGEALVVDPARDIQPYLDAAAAKEMRITHVAETHIHADYVSGGRELARRTGATLFLSDMGDEHWKYAYARETLDGAETGNPADTGRQYVQLVHDGDSFKVGNVRIDVIHTPGHTPEHVALVVTDTAGADRPIGVFTGDFLFAGDVGRPDLLEAAAGMMGTKEKGARDQFHTVARFKDLPDYLQIWPGHGAGSACGKALGAIPSTTLGYEKLFNPAFQFSEEDEFVEWLLADQPEAPRYFAQMKRVNKEGPALLAELDAPKSMTHRELEAALESQNLVIDLRPGDEFARSHLPGALSIPSTSPTFTTYVGWFVDYARPTYLIVEDAESLTEDLRALRAIGVDKVAGYAPAAAIGRNGRELPMLSADELAERLPHNGLQIIDVRGYNEYKEEHIEGAQNIPLGYLPRHIEDLPTDTTLVIQCASGYRSQIGASYLRAQGLHNVIDLNATKQEWAAALPTTTGA